VRDIVHYVSGVKTTKQYNGTNLAALAAAAGSNLALDSVNNEVEVGGVLPSSADVAP
jgi:hypothetical protein